VPTGLETAAACAEAYSTALAKFFALGDLVLQIDDEWLRIEG